MPNGSSFAALLVLLTISTMFRLCISFTSRNYARRLDSQGTRRMLSSSTRYAANKGRDFFTMDDLDGGRSVPPTLDGDDDEFGAYDYQPDLYDQDLALDAYDTAGQSRTKTSTVAKEEGPKVESGARGVVKEGKPRATSAFSVAKEEAPKVEYSAKDVAKEEKPREAASPPADFGGVFGRLSDPVSSPSAPNKASNTAYQRDSPTNAKSDSGKVSSPSARPKASNAAYQREVLANAKGDSDKKEQPSSAGAGAIFSNVSEPSPPKASSSYRHVAETSENWVSKAATYGQVTSDGIDTVQARLESIERDIYQQNGGQEFNINSPKQVSEILFGEPGQSTNKGALDAMAGGGNRMAALILQYRETKNELKRLQRRVENKEKGTLVRSASTVMKDNSVERADPLLLVDASAYIFRAYYSMPPIHRADGMPTGAVMGFCNMLNRLVLNRLIEGETPRLVLVFDAKGKTFRHERYSEYKANRQAAPIDLIPQFDLIREAAKAYGIQQIEAPSYEADDVIATLASMAKKEGIDTNILSGDKDLMQLITDEEVSPSVHMIDPMTMSRVTYKEVVEKWGVGPKLLGDVLALTGDSADNVPGVKGIGPKIAVSLIEEYGNLENLLNNLESMKQKARREKLMEQKDLALLSRELVELVCDVPMDVMTFPTGISQVSDLCTEKLDSDRLLDFYDRMGFRDLKRRVGNQLTNREVKKPKSRPKTPAVEIPTAKDFPDVPF